MNKKYDISGQTFGYLTVIRQDETTIGQRNSKWICKCKCGNTTVVTRSSLVQGHTSSCGCKLYESRNATHGMSNTRIYAIWCHMKRRCNFEKSANWKEYGGRGIKVCEEWVNNFAEFYKWSIENGYSDSLTIERKDVNGNYEPSNCEWITIEMQERNRRNTIKVSYNGETISLSELSEITQIPLHTLHRRYYRAKEKGIEIPTEKLVEPVNVNKTSYRYRKV